MNDERWTVEIYVLNSWIIRVLNLCKRSSKSLSHEFETWIRDKNFLTRMTIILTTDDTDSQQFAIIFNIENHGIHGYGSLTWMPINWPINFSLIQLPEVHSMRTKTKNTPLRGHKRYRQNSVAMKWGPAEIAEIIFEWFFGNEFP